MWKIVASLIGIVSVFGCVCIENPQLILQQIQIQLSNAYQFSADKIEENPSQIAAIVTPIGTTLGWLLIYVFFFRNSKTFKTFEEYKNAAQQKSIDAKNTDKKNEPEIMVADRAKARSLYQQLKQDLLIIEGRIKWLPDEIATAQCNLGDACHERNVAHNTLAQKESKVKSAEIRLDQLVKELDQSDQEIKAINQELEKLKGMI